MEILLFIMLLIQIGINIFMLIKQKRPTKVVEKAENKPKLTKDEEKKQKKIREAFENLMNYDENVARTRK